MNKITFGAGVIVWCLVALFCSWMLSFFMYPQTRAYVELSDNNKYCVVKYQHTSFLVFSYENYNGWVFNRDCFDTQELAIKQAKHVDDRFRDEFIVYK
jgi:hypothetical protein